MSQTSCNVIQCVSRRVDNCFRTSIVNGEPTASTHEVTFICCNKMTGADPCDTVRLPGNLRYKGILADHWLLYGVNVAQIQCAGIKALCDCCGRKVNQNKTIVLLERHNSDVIRIDADILRLRVARKLYASQISQAHLLFCPAVWIVCGGGHDNHKASRHLGGRAITKVFIALVLNGNSSIILVWTDSHCIRLPTKIHAANNCFASNVDDLQLTRRIFIVWRSVDANQNIIVTSHAN
mmetsp:Transcript_153395/g.270714  ORF Transcript_153395/g.270714 Transcript_153395/m.270714 type:complete len:237 (-) Transcript_153395:362-1072(-)